MRFRQEGRRGFVPTLEALEHMRLGKVGRGTGFYDERGRAIPNLSKVIPRVYKVQHFFQARDAQLVAESFAESRKPKDGYYSVLATWVDREGKLHVVQRNFRTGAALDRELVSRRLVSGIKGQLKEADMADEPTPEVEKWIRTRTYYVVK
jgi:hypothetical protein